MTRIILYFLLILTFSCGNALPQKTDSAQESPVPKTAVAEAPTPTVEKQSENPATPVAQKPAVRKAIAPQATPVAKPTIAPKAAPAETSEKVATATKIPAIVETVTEPAVTEEQPATLAVAEEEVAQANEEATPILTTLQPTATEIVETPSLKYDKKRFLPTRRRMDREINKLKFAYKGEFMMGLTASYGTLSSDDTDIMLIIDGIDANGSIATIKPFIGYFYSDNHCLGLRFGYRYMGGKLNNARYDLGESNDTSGSIPKLDVNSNNYSFGIFHRSYAGLDPKGRFGLFAEFELSVSTGTSKFSYQPDTSSDDMKTTFSDNTQVKLAFNPGAAVYIFPNVCATLSFGLGGIQYTSITQKDTEGHKIGSRKASNMKFKLNIAAINIGMTIHMWDKKKK